MKITGTFYTNLYRSPSSYMQIEDDRIIIKNGLFSYLEFSQESIASFMFTDNGVQILHLETTYPRYIEFIPESKNINIEELLQNSSFTPQGDKELLPSDRSQPFHLYPFIIMLICWNLLFLFNEKTSIDLTYLAFSSFCLCFWVMRFVKPLQTIILKKDRNIGEGKTALSAMVILFTLLWILYSLKLIF